MSSLTPKREQELILSDKHTLGSPLEVFIRLLSFRVFFLGWEGEEISSVGGEEFLRCKKREYPPLKFMEPKMPGYAQRKAHLLF